MLHAGIAGIANVADPDNAQRNVSIQQVANGWIVSYSMHGVKDGQYVNENSTQVFSYWWGVTDFLASKIGTLPTPAPVQPTSTLDDGILF